MSTLRTKPVKNLFWRRAVMFRVAAILLGICPFVLAEIALRASGWGESRIHHDPYIGFNDLSRLFELNPFNDEFEIASSRRVHFFPDSFAAHKPPDEFRIFCIGDSTVQGNPWETETSFTKWLEINLRSADPSRQWRVINCGGISYASYRMVPILEEILGYEPDLVMVHCSHNEFLEDRTYDHVKRVPGALWGLPKRISQLRLFQLVCSRAAQLERSPFGEARQVAENWRPSLSSEVEALLDYRGGLEHYHRDAAWQCDVIEHYEFNVRSMTKLARQAGTPLILLNPACQIRDCPPFKADNRAGLTQSQLQQWGALWNEARSYYASDRPRAIQLLHEALAIDDLHAGLHYDLAKCYDAAGQFIEAKIEYIKAKELDVCPLRILDSMNDIVLRVGRDTEVPVVDVRALFERLSRNGIPGDEWFADHVHPTIPGYQRVADEIADEMVRLGMLKPQSGWLERKQHRYEEHLNSLPASYFTRAQERLNALMLWARGRAVKERP